jgi:large repetitive protein
MKTLYIYLVNLVIYTQISCSISMIVTSDKNNATSTRLRGVVATVATTTTTTPASDKDRILQVGKVGKVVRLRVVSANNDDENGKRLLDPLNNGTIVDLARFPTNRSFNIEAVTSDTNGPIGSVSLTLWRGSVKDSEPRAYQKENLAPFSLCGDRNGDFYRCSVLNPSRSQYTIAVTPYELPDLKGRVGVTRTIRFTITDKSTVPVPVPAPVPPTRMPVARPTFSSAAWIQVDNDAPIDTRHEACFLMVGRKAYLLAGRSMKPVNIYDPVTRLWTSGTPPPKNIHHTQCVAVGTSIWIVSSWTGGYPLETNNDLIYVRILMSLLHAIR